MPFNSKREKRSPLKQKPLRSPGESLRNEMEMLFSDGVIFIVIGPVLVVLYAVFEWVRWYFTIPPQPVLWSVAAIIAIVCAAFYWPRFRKQYRALALGLEGEKAVGQYLESLHRQEWRIFHDVPGDGFNIDHVVISPQGVFAIETKTYSKPARGDAVVRVVGERVFVNGFEPERNPIRQSLATRRWLEEHLLASTGKRFPIRAVVLFPDWFVEPQTHRAKDTPWVLNQQALPSFVENEPTVLKPEDVALIASRLADYIRRQK